MSNHKPSKITPPTPEGLFEHLLNTYLLVNADDIKEGVKLAIDRYFVKCEECDGRGIVHYYCGSEYVDPDLILASGEDVYCLSLESHVFKTWEYVKKAGILAKVLEI